MFQLIAGVGFGIFLLSFVHKISFLGFECLVMAASPAGITASSYCIPPVIFYVMWACALGLAGWGLMEVLRGKTSGEEK